MKFTNRIFFMHYSYSRNSNLNIYIYIYLFLQFFFCLSKYTQSMNLPSHPPSTYVFFSVVIEIYIILYFLYVENFMVKQRIREVTHTRALKGINHKMSYDQHAHPPFFYCCPGGFLDNLVFPLSVLC